MNNLTKFRVPRKVQNEILWILFRMGLEHFCVIVNCMNHYLLLCMFSSEGQTNVTGSFGYIYTSLLA